MHNMQYPIDPRKTAERLREAIEARGELSQLKLSAESGVDQSQISRVLNGTFKTYSKNVRLLCKILGVEPEFLHSPSAGLSSQVQEEALRLIIDTFMTVWNHTPQHARVISDLIRATALMTSNAAAVSAQDEQKDVPVHRI